MTSRFIHGSRRRSLLLACLATPLVVAATSLPRGQTAAPAFAAYTEEIPNTDAKFEMVPVPGGTFMMGSPENEPGREPDEGPRHAVKVQSFWIGKFEVTWDEYDHFAFSIDEPPPGGSAPPGGADAITRPTPSYGDESRGFGKGRQPVVDISWHAAMEYTRWLSRVTGKAYRLATEAEWEYAARAGSDAAYSFGATAASLDDHAWYAANSKERPHPVGLKKPNKLGIHDLHGNAAEWCLDRYDADFYKKSSSGKPDAPAVLPVSLPTEARYPHVARGGSWADAPGKLRSAARRGSSEEWSRRDPQSPQSIWWHTDATIVGFRVVRAVEEYPHLRGLRSTMTRDSPDR
jgi:formylglycine-generating enzyme required for sulfatase activity